MGKYLFLLLPARALLPAECSSSADRSAFDTRKLGCTAFYPDNSSSRYIIPVRSKSRGDKEAVVTPAYAQSGLSERNYKYAWFDGVDAATLQFRFKSSKAIRVLNEYTLK